MRSVPERQAPLPSPPSPAPVSSHLPKHHRIVRARTLSSRLTLHTAAAVEPTARLTLSHFPPTAPASATTAVGSRSTPSDLSPPSDGRPLLSTLLSAAPPYLTRPLPLVHRSFHFLLLALHLTFPCPRVRPGCRTRCNSSRPRCTSNTPV